MFSSPPALFSVCFFITPPPPRSTLFPYTTLFRSIGAPRQCLAARSECAGGRHGQGPSPGSRQLARGPARVFHLRIQSAQDRKSTRLNSSHTVISYAVFCLKKKNSE